MNANGKGTRNEYRSMEGDVSTKHMSLWPTTVLVLVQMKRGNL